MKKTAKRFSADGRQSHLNTIYLLTHPDEIGVYLSQKRYAEVADLVEYLERDVPLELAQTDPALFRTLRRAVTELHISGYGGLNAQSLRKHASAGR